MFVLWGLALDVGSGALNNAIAWVFRIFCRIIGAFLRCQHWIILFSNWKSGTAQNRGDTGEDFERPLDLILFLLNKNKIEIQDIPLH